MIEPSVGSLDRVGRWWAADLQHFQITHAVSDDALLPEDRRCTLDQFNAGVDHALDQLLDHLGFSLAA